jgi:ABC-type nitrate/sulfonate/bicarbonate transport system substrate-binding protein
MRKRSLVALTLAGALVLAVAAAGCGGSSKKSSGGGASKTGAAPINMSFSTWIGYAPIIVGKKKGFFEKEGVKVSYTLIEDPVQRFAAFKAGRLDGIASTVDTFARTAAKGVPSKVVLGLSSRRRASTPSRSSRARRLRSARAPRASGCSPTCSTSTACRSTTSRRPT